MDKLKPCPFCGYEASMTSYYNDHFVQCQSCQASTRKYYATREEAIDAWNRRVARTMKPDKERLKELKFEYMKLYQNGYIKLPLLDDLLALIDSALAEPDADVAEAIEDLLSSYSCDMRLARMYLETPVLLKSVGLAITALRKMVKPQ